MLKQRKLKINLKNLLVSVLSLIMYVAVFYVLFSFSNYRNLFIIFAMMFAALASIFFSLFRDAINSTMVSNLPLSKIVVEDVLAVEHMPPEIVSKYKLPRLLKAKDIELLSEVSKKEKISQFPIYTGYPPFVPFIAIGFLFAVLFGNIFV